MSIMRRLTSSALVQTEPRLQRFTTQETGFLFMTNQLLTKIVVYDRVSIVKHPTRYTLLTWSMMDSGVGAWQAPCRAW